MWIVEFLKFIFSFVPYVQILEPDERQVVCFLWWKWVRKPGPRIVWPFWMAEQTDIKVSHWIASGCFVDGGSKTTWEATLRIEDPLKYAFNICGDEDEFIRSIVSREYMKEEEGLTAKALRTYGVELIDIAVTRDGVKTYSLDRDFD